MTLLKRLKNARLGWKQLLIIFVTLIVFQMFISHLQQNTVRDLLSETMDWYKQNSVEQISNLTASSLELLLESNPTDNGGDSLDRTRHQIHALNSILKQPLMKRNVEEMFVILPYEGRFVAMDLGQALHAYFYEHRLSDTLSGARYHQVVARYAGLHGDMVKTELISGFQEEQSVFHVFVPLVLYGEYGGAVYLRLHPDVSVISHQILTSFNRTILILSALVLMGLLAVFYISTNILVDRDEAWELLYKEREAHLREHVAQSKEHLFTKRIYHTHHKAEKVMGFINEDLDNANESNFKEIKYRVSKYANFISRVIYDMKWYSPPILTIRNQLFKTNLNEVLRFIVDNIFLRVSNPVRTIKFNFEQDRGLPTVAVNEFVVWEIVEPLIQNAIDHSDKEIVVITIRTRHDPGERSSYLEIEDNGKGIRPDLLETDESGIKRLFLENISTKEDHPNSGYGCYLAYEISKRCGWEIDAENKADCGSRVTLRLRHDPEYIQQPSTDTADSEA